MEPFDLKLHQVTYEIGSDSPDEVDSFSTVVAYDSQFAQVDTVPTTCSTPLTFTAATENQAKPRKLRKLPQRIPQPSRLKSTQIYSKSVSSIPSPKGHLDSSGSGSYYPPQEALINPNHNFIESQSFFTRRESVHISQTDIRTLFQVTSNSTSAKKFPRRPVMSEKPIPDKVDGTLAFQTMADALHLQKSVIGEKKITPASPDEVARIIAETQKKLSQPVTETSGASPLVPMASPEEIAKAIAETQRKMQSQATTTGSSLPNEVTVPIATPEEISRVIAETQRKMQKQSSNESSVKNTDFSSESPVENSDHKSVHTPPHMQDIPGRDLVRIPASSLQTSTQKSMSWLKGDHPASETELSAHDLNKSESVVSEATASDTASVASTDSFSHSDMDKFLSTLPPSKTIDISDVIPKTTSNYSAFIPAKRDSSFKPLLDQFISIKDLENKKLKVDNQPNSVPHMADSGISVDFESSKPQMLSPERSSTPKSFLPKHTEASHSHSATLKSIPSSSVSSEIQFDSAQKLNEALREKAKLEGQLEMLTYEANTSLKERTELQSQIATLKQKLKSQRDQANDAEKVALKSEVEKMQRNRMVLEKSLVSAQKILEEKLAEVKVIEADLQLTQEENGKLQIRLKEIRDDTRTKDMTIQALKNKIAELYVEVQTHMQAKIDADNEHRTAKTDVSSLISAKQWYQQQLRLANDSKLQLQQELTTLQAQALSQGSIIERMKTESARLRHQMKEIQQKALKDKEQLARHLERIQKDMMDREVAFQEVQRERTLLEGTFDSKLQSVEDERERYQSLVIITNDLESRLDRAHSDLQKKQSQINVLESEQIELNKQLVLSQEMVIEKDRVVEELQQKLLSVEAELKEFQKSVSQLDSEIWKLREEKAATEISLKSAMEEKKSVDSALDDLKKNMGKVEKTFKQMKQDLNTKSSECQHVLQEKTELQDRLDKCLADFEKEKREILTASDQSEEKQKVIDDLQQAKVKLESEVICLQNEVAVLDSTNNSTVKENQKLQEQLEELKSQLTEVETKLQEAKVQVEEKQQAAEVPQESDNHDLIEDNEKLKLKITSMEKQHQKDMMKQRARATKLSSDLKILQNELTERQSTFDSNVELLTSKIREISDEKTRLETELDSAQRKFDVGMVEQQDQMKTMLQQMIDEVESLKMEKQALESQLLHLQQQREHQIQEYQQRLSALDLQISQLQEVAASAEQKEEISQQLALELEKEKGKVEGLIQTNSSLKSHVQQLESTLAEKETSIEEMDSQMESNRKESEEKEREYVTKIQQLEEEQTTEKEAQRELRKQIGVKITENKKLRRNLDSLKNEKEILQQDLDLKTQESDDLRSKLESSNSLQQGKTSQINHLETENKHLRHDLEKAKVELADNLAKEPILQEQIQSLQWQISQKNKEVAAIQQTMEMTEQRQQVEIDSLRKTIEDNQSELESLREELGTAQREKAEQQAQVTELRTTLKASVQHHKLTKRINDNSDSTKDAGTQVENRDIVIPPLPFDLEAVERLLQETSAKALASKPLDNLQSCLSSLRSEISGLQKQIEIHTTTVAESTQNWGSVEVTVNEVLNAVKTMSSTHNGSVGINSISAAGVMDV
ncbi:golgin subfamily A member 3-like [Saccostrea echinata]|uniref:golgin subfamily A member 3-like n=1 Tax=Saccostrea echinata TaxID=191078 RepID=UPI002A8155C2|nr:golgin subfamily A member 3-like [Saccostrea echinata]